MAIFLPNGIGETLGDSLVTSKPLHSTGAVYYVSSVTGDASAPGTNKARPLNNLANAITAASNGDIIVLLDGHTETLTGSITINKSLIIAASGSSNGIPTVTYRASASGFAIFTISAAGVQLRNIRVQSCTVSNSNVRVSIGSVTEVLIMGCYFDCSGNDTGPAVSVAANATGFRCENTTFVSTATTSTSVPGAGLDLVGAITDVRLSGLVFDGGTHGFASGIAYVETTAPTRRIAESISLLRGADVSLHASALQSVWMPTTTSGDARVSL